MDGYLRPYHELDRDGVVVSTQMLTDAQADEQGLLKKDGEPRAARKRAARKPPADTAPDEVDADAALAGIAAEAEAAKAEPSATDGE